MITNFKYLLVILIFLILKSNLTFAGEAGTLKWEFETGSEVRSSPAIGADGTIYVGSYDDNLYAINPDGTKKWEFETGSDVHSSPAIGADGTIYVGSTDNNLYAINPDGTKKWEFETGHDVRLSPAIGADGTIYVGSADDNLYAINPDGTKKWEFETRWYVISSPAIGADGTIYVGSYDNNLYAIYSDSGGLADSPWPMFHHDVRHTGRFGFEEVEKSIILLTPGESYEGSISQWGFDYFSLSAEAGSSLLVEVVPQTGIDSIILDGKLGSLPPYAGSGDYTTREKTPLGKYELLISPAGAGTYYFSLFGYEVDESGGQYTITARYIDNYLSDLSPESAGNAGNVSITLKGLGFTEGMQVMLSGGSILTADEIVVTSATELSAQFDLTGAISGIYDVVAIWPNNAQLTLPAAFEITEGIGPRLEAHLDPPDAIRPGRKYTLWLEYENTGDADMPSPLFNVEANCSISLDSESVTEERVQILGIGSSAKVDNIQVGESMRIPIYFIAPSSGNAEFDLSVTRDSNEAIDWPAQKDIMKPPDMSQEEWDVLWPDLTTRLGDTWADYLGVLGDDALRIKKRGKDEYDVRKLIRLEARQASGEPIAAISGTLRDSDTKLSLKGVLIKVRNLDGSFMRQVETSYYPEGYFLIEDLPDDVYEVLVEGYYFETPEEVTVSGGEDVNGLVLYAKIVPSEVIIEEETGTPDHNPSIAKDEDENLYLVWEHGNEIWWASNTGNGWDNYDKIPNAAGSRPVITYDAALLDNGASPGLFCAWETGASPKTIIWSAGRLTEGSITWSEPQPLTSDSFDDYGIALIVDNNGNPLIIWLQKDISIEDDSDLYYNSISLANMSFNWIGQIDNEELTSLVEECAEIRLLKGNSLPKWIPKIGGKYGFEIIGQICGTTDCLFSQSGEIMGKIFLGENREISGNASVEGSWITDTKSCSYIFKEGSLTLGVGGSIEDDISPPIPIVILGVPIGTVQLVAVVEGGADGSLTWKSNFPALPDGGSITVSLGGGPKGVLKLLTGLLGGEVTGIITVGAEYQPPNSFDFQQYCISLEGTGKVLWGAVKKSWEKKWGTCAESEAFLAPLMIESYRDRLLKGSYNVIDTVPIYENLEYVKEPLAGTGSVYEGNPVLGDISQDVYTDGIPSVTKSDSGEIVVVWTKDYEASYLGSKVYAAIYDGANWENPVELTPDVDFNKDTAVTFDSNNDLMAVWSSASNDGLDYGQSTVEEILDAIDNADIMYARRVGDVWSTPETIATLPGRDEQVHISAGSNGKITAVWVNQTEGSSTIYTSIWDGSGWPVPSSIATAALAEGPTAIYTSGNPTVVWTQDSDYDIDTFDDWKLYESVWDGSTWSSPATIEVNQAVQAAKGLVKDNKQRHHFSKSGISLPPPSEECCENKDEDPISPDPPDSEKESLGNESVPVVVPIDPNEKESTQGEGEQHLVDIGNRLRYTVYFENLSAATAPAQETFITDCLDSNLDWTTIRTEEISFGDVILTNINDSLIFDTRATIPDYRDEEDKQWWVDISTKFDGSTGCLDFTLRTLDPETGELPEDVFAGFLPPEDSTGRGQGYITFTVFPKKDLEVGTTIWNDASIVFDTNEAIVTNEVFNTISGDVVPDIKANDSDGTTTIRTGDTLSITVSLSAGNSSGVNCDWWVAAATPFGWYYYSLATSWTSAGNSYTDLSPTYQGALFDLDSYTVLNTSGLSEGTHTFYFAVDTNMNGSLDMGSIYYDSVEVNVTP